MDGFDFLSFSRQDAKNAKKATIQIKNRATKGKYKFIGFLDCLFIRFINIQNASIVASFIEKTVNCEPITVNSYLFIILPHNLPPDHGVLLPAQVVSFRVADVVVQAATLLAVGGALDDQFGHGGDVAQFDEVR